MDTVGYTHAATAKHKLELRDDRYIIVELAHNHLSGSFEVRNLAPGEVVCRQNESWHPAATERRKTKADDGNGGRSDESVGAGIAMGNYRTSVKVEISSRSR